ncbi:MAG: hypothetical protein A3H69_03010 [Candidatus Sungbacteria bacterium RIFCSPLOWO2_02_FULL_47_9]|uniref:2-oxoglutarate dehydrogenase n=1 Tax=Candidatus Sungbacteria bacterium RIFCSPHIGHO2_01_FULL_47_32 TaxID=1802264 RepID=A0A1G2K616_9BACT|nr:MAG: hypothetical protein A2633_00055 [Candidatus Sungbacteria bacterium RIFCSPHIGHO2_01_FULL_47_32]OGZ99035.1 MAG: hypothetical protein A3D57_04845 [Candidatus Sungbacteria bacterium RIFCSPHIGHO2_02_FULL_46_12]OHA10588.1 MAG: hypothetical protein A3H69_03010 [Candidatus Sungbacteria bacterium RIFCSPLOWO2_02_FULL_47_9]
MFFGTWALSLSFLIALGALAASLFYSEYAGFEPCTLCWYQRIFIYPQVFLLGLGLYKKDASILRYTIWLSVVGAIIAGYHSLLQFGFVPALPCSAAVVSCTQRFVSLYGYITIPVMSFAAFVLSVCLALANRKTERQA